MHTLCICMHENVYIAYTHTYIHTHSLIVSLGTNLNDHRGDSYRILL